MSKDTVTKRTIVIEVEIKVRSNDEKYFEKVLKDRVKDLCLDIWSGEVQTGNSVSIDTTKSKLVSIKKQVPRP